MRVADRSTTRNYLTHLNGAKSNLAKTSAQIYSGNRFESMSEDVSAGTRVLRAQMDMHKSSTHLENVQSIGEELAVAEDNMMSIEDILSQAHAIAVKAANGDKTDETVRETLANEIGNLKDQLITFANAKYGNKFLFGGSNASLAAPFKEDENGRLTYNGIPVDDIEKDDEGNYFHIEKDDEGNPVLDAEGNPIKNTIPMDGDVYMDIGLGIKMNASQVKGDTGFLVSFSGLDIIGFGKDPETGLSNNIFNTLADLESGIRDGEDFGKLDTQLVSLTDDFRGNLTDMGSKTQFLETMQGSLENNVDSYKIRIDNLMGTHDEEAIMTLSSDEYVLKAVQQMGARILPLSLMDFLR